MDIWYFGNTTVRSPFRLRDGLVALFTSPLQGNLRGEEQEKAFRNLLGEHGIVELGEDATYSVGRKWRGALTQLGFLYPKVPASINQADIGILDTITPNGMRLIRAETVPAMQECFLRSLTAYFIPSVLEKDDSFAVFSPLRHTLAIMLELEKKTGSSHIEFIEMAVIVQLSNSSNNIEDIVNNILALRKARLDSKNKRAFDNQARKDAVTALGKYKEQTFNDYTDLSFRYLKATGLVHNKGRGISIVPEKHVFIETLVQDTSLPVSDTEYVKALCEGAKLPTDDQDSALIVLDDLINQLKKRNIPFSTKAKPTANPADIAIIRHEIENLLSENNEEEFAKKQASEWQEIAGYMQLIITRKRSLILEAGNEIEVPQSEAPAYFEWILWRAFLAINSLSNKPYEARRFKIDQDFLPVGTAPGGGPDLIFEFADFVIVVEVTLTQSSRQEAVEGEPVRRHVADLVMQYEKPVYGLFIANKIDLNTAETFRIGVWYAPDEEKMRLDIIPVTLSQFKDFFEALFTSGNIDVNAIRDLLDECSEIRKEHEAPAWKQEIDKLVTNRVSLLQAN